VGARDGSAAGPVSFLLNYRAISGKPRLCSSGWWSSDVSSLSRHRRRLPAPMILRGPPYTCTCRLAPACRWLSRHERCCKCRCRDRVAAGPRILGVFCGGAVVIRKTVLRKPTRLGSLYPRNTPQHYLHRQINIIDLE
jgi:hypothetical protein